MTETQKKITAKELLVATDQWQLTSLRPSLPTRIPGTLYHRLMTSGGGNLKVIGESEGPKFKLEASLGIRSVLSKPSQSALFWLSHVRKNFVFKRISLTVNNAHAKFRLVTKFPHRKKLSRVTCDFPFKPRVNDS